MTEFDFMTRIDRSKTNAIKTKAQEDEQDLIPLWIADMDFVAFPELQETAHSYADQQIYGYTYAAHTLFDAIQYWEEKQHHYTFDKEAIILVEGVVPAIGLAIQSFTQKNDGILINSPAYPPFARTIELNERKLFRSPLIEKEGLYFFDFVEMEDLFKSGQIKLYILCSPHNPGGRVWTKDELFKIGKLCQKYHVLLIADEIHQDLIWDGTEQHSFNTLSPEFKNFAIIISSATKTFNLAGTKCAFAIIENLDLRKKYLHQRLVNNQHEINSLGLMMTETAFRYGAPWLSALKAQIQINLSYLMAELTHKTAIKIMKPQGTYLVWLDFSSYDLTDNQLHQILIKDAKVMLNKGSSFGVEGELHARLNLASPYETIKTGVDRLVNTFGK